MLPDGWSATKFATGFTSSREKGHHGLPTLSVTIAGGLIDRDSIDRKMETNLDPGEHLFVRKGDIAYNMMRMWQGASGLADHDAIVSPAYVVLRAKKGMDPLFASYLFKLPRTVHLFWSYSYGLTDDRLRLYPKDFGMIPVNLPPHKEQRRIAEILSTWDKAIAVQEKLVANAKANKKALMQQLLTSKKRLPGFKGEWKQITLGSLGRCFTGLTYAPDDTVKDHGLLVLRSSNVQSGLLSFEDNVYVKPNTAVSTLTQLGDILVCVRNGSKDLIGKTARITEAGCGMAHGAFMTLFRSSEPDFAYHLFKSREYVRQVKRNLGATINSINNSDLLKFTFVVPPKEERKAVAQFLDHLDEDVTASEHLLLKLRTEKSALMQQLLTGKRRVKVET
jgi:type I restriction enzyme, S subunit